MCKSSICKIIYVLNQVYQWYIKLCTLTSIEILAKPCILGGYVITIAFVYTCDIHLAWHNIIIIAVTVTCRMEARIARHKQSWFHCMKSFFLWCMMIIVLVGAALGTFM